MKQNEGKIIYGIARKKQKKTIHNVVLSVDSQEEIDTLSCLTECKQLGIINDFSYQPDAFTLSDPVKYQDVNNKSRTLFQEHKYTADWVLEFTPGKFKDLAKEFKVPFDQLSCQNYKVYLDSKGTFNRTERSFGYNQKWLYQRFKVYVYKLVPKRFFAKFGLPDACQLTQKTKKPRTMFKGFLSIKEIFKTLLK